MAIEGSVMNNEHTNYTHIQGSIELTSAVNIPNDHWWHVIHASDRMREVLALFFEGEYPYRLYSQVAKDTTTLEEDNAFDAEVKCLEAYFVEQRKASGQ
jgi:hypothetical protein